MESVEKFVSLSLNQWVIQAWKSTQKTSLNLSYFCLMALEVKLWTGSCLIILCFDFPGNLCGNIREYGLFPGHLHVH